VPLLRRGYDSPYTRFRFHAECDGFVCGTGAQCIVSYDGPTCKCIEGFMGNPFPGGQCVPDVCSPEIPCAEPSVCISGRCKRRCEGVVCGIGAMCDPLTNKCVCNPYFVGNPDLLCMPREYDVLSAKMADFPLGKYFSEE